jgi:hypothetical protein
MTADIINLRRIKKNIKRTENEKTAEANRQKFGRAKIEKTLGKFETARNAADLNGKKLND